MFALFDQSFNKEAPELTGEKWGMIRDLNKVWASTDCQSLAKKCGIKAFDGTNTLMLETEEIDVHDWIDNSLIVDRYDRDDVWPSSADLARD